METLPTALGLIGGYLVAGVVLIGPQASLLWMFGMMAGRLRVFRRRGAVRLAAFDGPARAVAVLVLAPVPIVACVAAGLGAALAAAVIAGALVLGCRVHVDVTPTETWVRRRVAFVIPWRSRRYPGAARAYVDGWGDIADPRAFCLGFPGPGAASLELAWVGGDDRAEALAEAFNAAVAAIGGGGLA